MAVSRVDPAKPVTRVARPLSEDAWATCLAGIAAGAAAFSSFGLPMMYIGGQVGLFLGAVVVLPVIRAARHAGMTSDALMPLCAPVAVAIGCRFLAQHFVSNLLAAPTLIISTVIVSVFLTWLYDIRRNTSRGQYPAVCSHCGYELTGLGALPQRCPECGELDGTSSGSAGLDSSAGSQKEPL